MTLDAKPWLWISLICHVVTHLMTGCLNKKNSYGPKGNQEAQENQESKNICGLMLILRLQNSWNRLLGEKLG